MTTNVDFAAILPEIVLLCGACAVLLADLFISDARRHVSFWLTQAVLFLVAWSALANFPLQPAGAFSGMVVDDMLADTLKFLCAVSVSLMLFYSRGYSAARGLFRGETFVLSLFALLGMMVMIAAGSFVTLYLGLELLSLSLYAMVAMYRTSNRATEAAMKYFVLGALASGILLYGMSMIYGATGSLDIVTVAKMLAGGQGERTILIFGLVFLVSGVAFKLGAVPYHMWVPDVYDGAPTAVTLLIGTAPKLAAFAFMLRLLAVALGSLWFDWQGMLMVLAVLSMILGNVVAIAQTSMKRMLAYSSIANMGFMLMGFPGRQSQRLQRGDVLRHRLCADEPRLLRHDHAPVARRLRGRPARRLQGSQPALAVVGVHDAARHVLARRRPADRRLLREVRRDPGGRRRRIRLAGRGRGHDVADRRVLLPARRQADVFRRCDRRRSDRSARGQPVGAVGSTASACSPSASSRSSCSASASSRSRTPGLL